MQLAEHSLFMIGWMYLDILNTLISVMMEGNSIQIKSKTCRGSGESVKYWCFLFHINCAIVR